MSRFASCTLFLCIPCSITLCVHKLRASVFRRPVARPKVSLRALERTRAFGEGAERGDTHAAREGGVSFAREGEKRRGAHCPEMKKVLSTVEERVDQRKTREEGRVSQLTAGVDGSRGSARIGGEGSVEGIRSGDLSSRSLDGKVGAGGPSRSDQLSFGGARGREGAYTLISDLTSPETRRFHASLHSWMISKAYLRFLASPEKANWFSGCVRRAFRSQQLHGRVGR